MTTPVDAHVHLHAEFETDGALTAAMRRFATVGTAAQGILCLTESGSADGFASLEDRIGGGAPGDWTVHRTDEEESIRCEHRGGGSLFVLAGRQVVSAEDLEVLALATRERWEDGMPFLELVEKVRRPGVVPVVPWGFGKWWGRRGRLVREAFDRAGVRQLFAGDNGGRWQPAGAPLLLRELRSRGVRVLPGSDPLPLPGQARRVGSAGFRLDGRPDPRKPAAWLRSRLQDPNFDPEPFGDGVGLGEFVLAQARMQWRKRGRARA